MIPLSFFLFPKYAKKGEKREGGGREGEKEEEGEAEEVRRAREGNRERERKVIPHST